MNRHDKIALLVNLLRGKDQGLRLLQQNQDRIRDLAIVERMPTANDEPVNAMFHLNNGQRVVERLTLEQLADKGARLILPHNWRQPIPEFDDRH